MAVPIPGTTEPIAAPAAPAAAAPTPVATGCEPGAWVIGSGFVSRPALALRLFVSSALVLSELMRLPLTGKCGAERRRRITTCGLASQTASQDELECRRKPL